MYLEKIYNLFFPPRCLCCNEVISYSQLFCEECSEKIKKIKIPEATLFSYKYGKQYFEKCVAAYYYKKPISDIICKFKFKEKWCKASTLSKLIYNVISIEYSDYDLDILTFVPEHNKRKKHTIMLAKLLSYNINVNFKSLLNKAQSNNSQHKLTRFERLKNVNNVYTIRKNVNIKGKSILLIDDIVTTGSTLNECAKVLKLAGAETVFCAAIAATEKLKG